MASSGAQRESTADGNPRVIMWCVPRSVSTAVTKCMSFVEGAEIWMEPYCVSKTLTDMCIATHNYDRSLFPLEYDGNEEFYTDFARAFDGQFIDIAHPELLSPAMIKKKLDCIDPAVRFVFVKDMGFGIPPSRFRYLPDKESGFRHLFLIRHPVKVYKSFRKAALDLPLPEMDKKPDPETFNILSALPPCGEDTEFTFRSLHRLWGHLRERGDEGMVIMDIDDLITDPSKMLPRLFHALNIPYSEDLLTWDQSADVVLKWRSVCPNVRDAPHYSQWFRSAFKSTCFKPSSTTTTLEGVTPDIIEVVQKEMPYYEEMYKMRITP
ncbi:uncharacterized protein [Diadema setosum]|uniref:uncharacterized protein n=1 Tax=Diadema setosum TaxID=31175 RepID=UPI003B3A556A